MCSRFFLSPVSRRASFELPESKDELKFGRSAGRAVRKPGATLAPLTFFSLSLFPLASRRLRRGHLAPDRVRSARHPAAARLGLGAVVGSRPVALLPSFPLLVSSLLSSHNSSTNPTLLNDKELSVEAVLRHGDVFSISKRKFKFMGGLPQPTPSTPVRKSPRKLGTYFWRRNDATA